MAVTGHLYRALMSCVGCGRRRTPVCPRCRRRLAPPPVGPIDDVDAVVALFAYEHVGALLVQSLKFHDGRALVAPLATGLARAIGDLRGMTLTWAPTAPSRRRARGFDQAELLARAVGRRCGARAVRVLTRAPGASQTDRSARERVTDPPRFRAAAVDGPVVVVDDVCTTGATLSAAARALRAAGAAEVYGLVVARTP